MAKSTALPNHNPIWKKARELRSDMQEEARLLPLELPKLKPFIPRGLMRGSLVEIIGPKSSGRTSTSLYVLAESISNLETCAYIDLTNQFDPISLLQSGVCLDNLSWVKCNGNTVHAFRSADLLLHAGGFGVVLLDLCGANQRDLNKIPISYWFRFQRIIENTPTILLICSEFSQARSCSRHSLEIHRKQFSWTGESPALLDFFECTATVRKASHFQVTAIRPESLMIHSPQA